MALFSVPVVAPLLLRVALSSAAVRRNMVGDIPVDQIHHSETLARDAAHSVKTYPANYFRSFSSSRRGRAIPIVDVPVQLIVNSQDPYVRPYGYDQTARWVPRLWRRDIKAGHFSPMSHPQVMAAAVHDFADLADGKQPSRALLRAQVGRPRGYFGDTLVSVTGAGSGIGRETALAFAREGAEIVISDIDEATVKDTAAEIAARGGIAYPMCSTCPTPRRSRHSPSGSAPNTGSPTLSSTTPASARRVGSWTPRLSSSTGCWPSTWAAW